MEMEKIKIIDAPDAMFLTLNNKASIESIIENITSQAKNGFAFIIEVRHITNEVFQELLRMGYKISYGKAPMGEKTTVISWED